MRTMIYVLLAAVCVILYAGCGTGTAEKSAQSQPEKTGKLDITPDMGLSLDNPADKETPPAEVKTAEKTALPAEKKTPAAEEKPAEKPAEETAPLEKIKLAEDTPAEEVEILTE